MSIVGGSTVFVVSYHGLYILLYHGEMGSIFGAGCRQLVLVAGTLEWVAELVWLPMECSSTCDMFYMYLRFYAANMHVSSQEFLSPTLRNLAILEYSEVSFYCSFPPASLLK